MNTRKQWLAPLAVALMVAAPLALAGKGRHHDDDSGPGGGFMAQAVDACAGKSAGTEVTLTGRDGGSLHGATGPAGGDAESASGTAGTGQGGL